MKATKPFSIIEEFATYRDGIVERKYGSWTVKELSREYPISISGTDAILADIPVSQQERTTIVFYDNERRAFSHDPRVVIEDIDLI